MPGGDFTISFDHALLEALMPALNKELESNLAKIALKAASLAQGAIRREIMSRLTKHPTGALARSTRVVLVESKGSIVSAIAGPERKYARIQNDGGVISSDGKKLAIPLSFAGVPLGKAPKDFSSNALKVIPRPGKSTLLALNQPGPLKPMYVLKDAVRIPGVHYREAAQEKAGPTIEEMLKTELEALLERVSERAHSA